MQAPELEMVFRQMVKHLHHLSSSGWRPRRDIDNFVIWSPRQYNVVADHLVNAALDMQSDFWQHDDTSMRESLRCNEAFRVCVDGGVRRNGDRTGQRRSALGGAFLFVKADFQMVRAVTAAQLVDDVTSAFQAEVLALDSMLSFFVKTVCM